MAAAADDGGLRLGVSYFEVRFRLHPALVVALVVTACATTILGLAYSRSRRTATLQGLVSFLPDRDGTVLAMDIGRLRRAGLLSAVAGSGVAQEPEYVAFVQDTGFDYAADLDQLTAWFGPGSVCMLLRGRFDWDRLRQYAAKQGGTCQNSFCRMEGSTPQRRISFFPLSRSVMALAVGPDEWAATALTGQKPLRQAMLAPDRAAWLLLSPAVLKDSASLPSGTRLFAKAVEGAERVMLSLQESSAGIAIELDVACRSAEDADTLAFQLRGVTELLKKLIAREDQTPSGSDLSGVLAAGVFNRVDTRVLGRWPVRREFLDGILETAK